MRCDRYYSANGQWYFTTREGREIGPFPYRRAAETRLEDYIIYMKVANAKRLALHKTHFA